MDFIQRYSLISICFTNFLFSQLLNYWCLCKYVGRSVATVGNHGAMPPPPRPTSISEPNKVNSFSFKHQGYYFLRAFRNYMDRKFHDFYRVFNNFWTIYDEFSFFLHKENASLHVGPIPTETSLK